MHRRGRNAEHGGLWEFPGGKIEPDESPEWALCRELEEELGIVVAGQALGPAGFASGVTAAGRPIVILLYTCRAWQGTPRCLEGEEIGWHAAEAIPALAMPPLDYPLAEGLIARLKNAK